MRDLLEGHLSHFFDVRGVQEQFLGTVKEVWWSMEQKTFYAQVNYEDGDLEDIPVEELINLLTEETCKRQLMNCSGQCLK